MSARRLNEEGVSPLDRGRARYAERDYKGALEAFTEAVGESTGFLLHTALDHRAAALEKLEQLHPALKDAKRMIELKPELSKGYLRCGKILQLKGENKLALKIYERGLKKVKIGGDEQRTMLQTMFNKLRHAQDPGRTRDPLAYLPIELAQMICLQLALRDRVICLAVSKSWKRVLESSHELWTTLDTTPARKGINKTSLRAHFRRSNYTLDRAIITTGSYFDASKMSHLTKTCKQLKVLDIRGPAFIGEMLTSALPDAQNLETLSVSKRCEILEAAAMMALQTCKNSLLEASFLNIRCPRASMRWDRPRLDMLQSLDLRAKGNSFLDIVRTISHQRLSYRTFWRKQTDTIKKSVQEATPNLKRLVVHNWTCVSNCGDLTPWTSLEYLDFSSTNLVRLPRLPITLRHLILEGNSRINMASTEQEGEYIFPAMLQTLNLHGTYVDGVGLKEWTAKPIENGQLKSLHAGNCPERNSPDAFLDSETLEMLSMRNSDIGDTDAMGIVDRFPNLQRLDFSWTHITGVAVKHFVNKGVRWLNLSECHSLSADAVEWARGRGVEVEFSFPSRSSRPGSYRDARAGAY